MPHSPITVRDLRRLWKPYKELLNSKHPSHPTNVRFHRACSWIQRAEQFQDSSDFDFVILSQWTAFNALYGQWDGERQEPVADRECWRHFVERILGIDKQGYLVDTLSDNKPLVMSIFDDEHLSRYFWQDPSTARAARSRRSKFDAQTWYVEGNWLLVLDHLIERVYLLRCQLVHGAATYNSKLNRTATRRCAQMMDHLMRGLLLVWIQFGSDQDWGIMCYPPMNAGALSLDRRGS